MVLASTPWYENGTLWTIVVGAVVAVGVGVLTAIATFRAARPRRRLEYCLSSNTPLLNTTHQAATQLVVTFGSTAMTRPRVVEVEISNVGRHDITAADFHNAEPITFDFGAPIVALLSSETRPTLRRVPSAVLDGQTLKIEPSLVSRRQVASFSLLVDGPVSGLQVQHSLVDVDVRLRDPEDPERAARWLSTLSSAGAAVATMLIAIISAWLQ